MSRYGTAPAVILRLAGLACAIFSALFIFIYVSDLGRPPFAFGTYLEILSSVLVIYVGVIGVIGLLLFLFGRLVIGMIPYVIGVFFSLAFGVMSAFVLTTGSVDLIMWLPATIGAAIAVLMLLIAKARKRSFPIICLFALAAHFFAFFWLYNAHFGLTFAMFFSTYWANFLGILLAMIFLAIFSGKFYSASYGRKKVRKDAPKPVVPTREWKEKGMLYSNKEY